MSDAGRFADYWKGRIERDLTSFGDPGALVDVRGTTGRAFRAAWTMQGVEREAMFSVSRDAGVSVTTEEGRTLPYRSFVAGSDMADLQRVARMILQAMPPGLFVETGAERSVADGDTRKASAVGLLADLLEEEDGVATRVVMVTADAGAGKTCVLKELVRRYADDYLHGRTRRLLLYVDAQGRSLARLNEALATELQDLKVGLTYHSVATLARLGILVPVIDGFDELLGVSGYDDAFSSLAGFLDQLEGEGQLLASARSVYYEEEFLARAGRVSATGDQRWSHVPVHVLEWSDDDRRRYLDEWIADRGLTDEAAGRLRRRVEKIFARGHEELAKKPLFLARVVELLRNDREFSGGDDLLQALVREYLSRERNEKLLDRQSGSLLTEAQFERLMCELAQEMWNQETRELDSRSVREVAEFFVENEENESLSDTAKQSVVERMPALAFLARSDGRSSRNGGISFEHELFFSYFLAGSIVSEFSSASADVRIVLSRSALPGDVAERVAAQLHAWNETGGRDGAGARDRLQKLLDRLADAGRKEWRRTMQVRENAGLLVMALLQAYADAGEGGCEIDVCTVRSVVFPGSRLRDVTLRRCSLVDVDVRRTDLTTARFVECAARNVLLFEPRVAPGSTRLELQGLEVSHVTGLRLAGSTETFYEPSTVAAKLRECGAPTADPDKAVGSRVPPEYVELVGRLVRAYRRANPVCAEDPALAGLFGDPKWAAVERLLIDHEIVAKEQRATSGRPKTFLRRRVLPEQMMSGRPGGADGVPRVRSFWRALKSETASGGGRSDRL